MALLALGLAACTPAPRAPLVVGTVPWVGTEPLFLAREQGLFPGPIHLTEYMNSAHELRAFHNGVIDAAAVTLEEVVNLDYRGQQAQVVLVLDASYGADCLVARPEVKTLADLKGRKVGSEDVMLPTYMLQRALEQVRLGPGDVERVYQGPDESEVALREGKVDAVVAYSPYCQRMVAAGAHVLFDSTRIPNEIVDVLVVRRGYLEANPEQVDALLKGWFAALAFIRDNPAEAAGHMGPRLGMEGARFLEAMKGVHHPDVREQHTLLVGERPGLRDSIERLGAVMKRGAGMPEHPIPEGLIDSAPLRRVAP
jgi:NitT/TauT family transport system substrate-binding protein